MSHRTLLVLRHAKSSWDQPELADFDRPLAPRGKRAAAAIGRYLRERRWRPDLVLCSPAARTQQTWALVAAELGDEVPCRLLRTLYLASPSRFWLILQRAPDAASCLMLIGHNPGLASFAAALCGTGAKRQLRRLSSKFPTAALAVVSFEAEHWSGIEPRSGQLDAFIRPKDLG